METKYRMMDALKIQKMMLRMTCTWPSENDNLLYKTIMVFWGFISLVNIFLIWMESVKKMDNITEAMSVLQVSVPVAAYYFKFSAFVYNKKLFIELLKLMDDDIFYDHDYKLNIYIDKAIKNSQTLTKLFGITAAVFVVIYVFLPIVNGTNYPTPLTTDFGPYKPLIYFIQAAGMITSGTNNAAIDCLCLSLLTLGTCQFDVLKGKLKEVREYAVEDVKNKSCLGDDEFDVKVDESIERRLKNAVKHHNALIRFLRLFEEIFSFGLLMQFLTSVASIAASGFNLLLVPPTFMEISRAVLIFVLLLSEIFIYCYFSDIVIWKSLEVGDACYFSEWYKCNSKVRKMLLIIIQRSQKPVTITIMKYTAFSLQLFANILRTSYSYFALLLRLSNKND